MRIYVSTFFKNMNFEYLHAFSGTGVAFVCALYELFLNEKFRGVGTGWVEWAFLHLGCPPNVWQTQGIENHIICSQRFIFTIWPPISRLHPKHLTGMQELGGHYLTSRPDRKSVKFSKFGLSGNRTLSLPDTGLLTLLKIEEKIKNFKKKFQKKIFNIFLFTLIQIF